MEEWEKEEDRIQKTGDRSGNKQPKKWKDGRSYFAKAYENRME